MDATPDRHVEIEQKFEVPDDARVPDLSTIIRGGSSVRPRLFHLRAVYFDTAALDLTRARITLRRREGGEDAGWHVKRADPEHPGRRIEQRWPLTAPALAGLSAPAEVRALIEDVTDGEPVTPVAVVSTERRVHRVLDAQGRLAVEVADDSVTARAVRSGAVALWREWEAELGEDMAAVPRTAQRIAREAAQLLGQVGATPSASRSKLARALGPDGSIADDGNGPRGFSLGAVVGGAIGRHAAELVSADPSIRADEHDAVHQARILVRRLRSLLDVYGSIYDAERVRLLRKRLRRFGRVLGGARDSEVRLAFAQRRISQLREEIDDPSAGQSIIDDLSATHQLDHAALVRYLDGAGHKTLIDDLAGFVSDPPVTVSARFPAEGPLSVLLGDAVNEVFDRAIRADRALGRAARELELHETRKAARRLRYAANAVTALPGPSAPVAKALSKIGKRMQDLLGDHRDEMLFAEHVERASGTALTAEQRTALQRLVEASNHDAAEALEQYPNALTELHTAAAELR